MINWHHVPVNENARRQEPEDHEPEPQKNVNLFVDGVQRQYTNGVVRFDLAGHTELVENALSHPGKYENHWVHPIFLVALQKPDHVHPERQKRTVKEAVHHEHLTLRKK